MRPPWDAGAVLISATKEAPDVTPASAGSTRTDARRAAGAASAQPDRERAAGDGEGAGERPAGAG
jgi:hypothetical protein